MENKGFSTRMEEGRVKKGLKDERQEASPQMTLKLGETHRHKNK